MYSKKNFNTRNAPTLDFSRGDFVKLYITCIIETNQEFCLFDNLHRAISENCSNRDLLRFETPKMKMYTYALSQRI